jgi:hypothetical protein
MFLAIGKDTAQGIAARPRGLSGGGRGLITHPEILPGAAGSV